MVETPIKNHPILASMNCSYIAPLENLLGSQCLQLKEGQKEPLMFGHGKMSE